MPVQPDILRTVANHRKALDRQGARTASALTRRYAQSWRAISKDLDALILRMQMAQAAGQALSPGWLAQEVRYRALLTQIEQQVTEFSQYAYATVRNANADVITAAQQNAHALIRASKPGITGAFSALPVEAINTISGIVGPNSPLQIVFASLGRATSQEVADLLVSGVIRGLNPRVVARQIRAATGAPLTRCLTIARTEQLRAYREASRASYQRSQAVASWTWFSALDKRGCPACWAMHGTVHPLNEAMQAHPNCRCTMLPNVDGWTSPVPTGAEEFDKLTPTEQQVILGPSKWRAYKDGAITLDDMVARHFSPVWGTSVQERSLTAAVGATAAAKYFRP